jgi:3-oxoacyl-[acyl-carrier-protein] synthase-3
VRTGAAGKVLVVGAEVLSSLLDYEDRATSILFGDGAGAALLAPADGRREIGHVGMGSDGSGFELLWQPAGGSRRPASEETVRAREHYLKMQGRAIFKIAVQKFQDAIREAAGEAGWGLGEVDLVVPHQVNTRIIDAVAERLEIPAEKFYQNLDRYGNTSAASIPIALHEAEERGLLKAGDKVILAAVGGGITWGSAAILW